MIYKKVIEKFLSTTVIPFLGLFLTAFVFILFPNLKSNFYTSYIIQLLGLFLIFTMLTKMIFNIKYMNLKNDIVNFRYNFIDNLLYSLIIIFGLSFTALFINTIDFFIDPSSKESIKTLFINASNNYSEQTNMIDLEILFNSFCIVIVIFLEEIYFRYSLYEIYEKNTKIFILLSSISFGIYHGYSIARILSSFIIGISLAIVYVKTKNIIYPIIIHFIWNLGTYFSSYIMFPFRNLDIGISIFSILSTEFLLFICIILILFIKYMILKYKRIKYK